MSITIPSRVLDNVCERRVPQCGIKWMLEDGIEESIKLNLGILE